MQAFFVTGTLAAPPAAVEAALYERVKVFATLGVRATIVTLGDSPTWPQVVGEYGVQPEQVVSVFDQIQQVPALAVAPFMAAKLAFPSDWAKLGQAEGDEYHRQDQLRAKVWRDEAGHVDAVDYFDESGTRSRRDLYDCRGFLSQVRHYAESHLRQVTYLTPQKQTAATQDFNQGGLLTLNATGAQYASFAGFVQAMLQPLANTGALIMAERREYDAAVAQLQGVKHGYRLREGNLRITPQADDVIITSQFHAELPQAKVFDEDRADVQLQRGWQRILEAEGVIEQQ